MDLFTAILNAVIGLWSICLIRVLMYHSEIVKEILEKQNFPKYKIRADVYAPLIGFTLFLVITAVSPFLLSPKHVKAQGYSEQHEQENVEEILERNWKVFEEKMNLKTNEIQNSILAPVNEISAKQKAKEHKGKKVSKKNYSTYKKCSKKTNDIDKDFFMYDYKEGKVVASANIIKLFLTEEPEDTEITLKAFCGNEDDTITILDDVYSIIFPVRKNVNINNNCAEVVLDKNILRLKPLEKGYCDFYVQHENAEVKPAVIRIIVLDATEASKY